jgi:hypothetical protein
MQQLALKIAQAGGLLCDHKFLVAKVPKDDQSSLMYMVLGGNHHVKVLPPVIHNIFVDTTVVITVSLDTEL